MRKLVFMLEEPSMKEFLDINVGLLIEMSAILFTSTIYIHPFHDGNVKRNCLKFKVWS